MKYPPIKVLWDTKDLKPKYEIPIEYYKIYNPHINMVLKYPIPEIITEALQELFRNQQQHLEQLGLDTMEGINKIVDEVITT